MFRFTLLVLAFLVAACSSAPSTGEPTPTATSTPEVVLLAPAEGTSAPALVAPPSDVEPSGLAQVTEQIINTPTPELTATPGPIGEAVAEIAVATGLDRQVILGLTGEDWVNLGISLLIALLGVFVVTRLVYLLLLVVARTTPGERTEAFLRTIQAQVRWFVVVLIVQFATSRLLFLSPELKQNLNQLYFTLYVVVGTAILWKLITSSLAWYQERTVPEGEVERANVFLPLLKRLLHALLVIVAVTIVLNNYGVNVTALLAVLGIGGLALSLAAQDTLSDMINGFLILLDQPFRVGDRIGIEGLDTWGDIMEVGARTTRIRTRDNRLVILPNSKIGKSQVVNYTYPDPRYRVQTEIGIAYGSDHEQVSQIIVEAVRSVDGVLVGKPVDALLLDLGDSAMKFRVRWWIDSYTDTRFVYDRVHRALLDALDQAGIEMPFTTYDLNLKMSPEQVARLSQAFGESGK